MTRTAVTTAELAAAQARLDAINADIRRLEAPTAPLPERAMASKLDMLRQLYADADAASRNVQAVQRELEYIQTGDSTA